MHAVVLLRINQHTKFDVPSFTDSEDMIWIDILPAYKIWRLSL